MHRHRGVKVNLAFDHVLNSITSYDKAALGFSARLWGVLLWCALSLLALNCPPVGDRRGCFRGVSSTGRRNTTRWSTPAVALEQFLH